MPKWSPKWRYFYKRGASFLSSCSGLAFSGCQGPPRDPKLRILAPKMDPQSSQDGPPKLPKWCPRALQSHPKWLQTRFQNRPMLKTIMWISMVIPKKIYTNKVLRRCSAQRAQLAKNAPETDHKSDWNFDRILNRFCIDLGSTWAPTMDPKWL